MKENPNLEKWQLEDIARLKRLFDTREPKMSQAEFGSQFEIGSQGMVWQYLTGRRPLNLKAAAAFARGLGTTLGAISPTLAAQVSEYSNAVESKPTEIPGARPVAIGDPAGDPSRTPIRKYKEVHLRAGAPGGFAGELDQRSNGQHFIPTRWIERRGFNPAQLFAIEVKGESMQDTFYDGDTVVVNQADRAPMSGEFFAVNVENEALVKRLSKRGPRWVLQSDNPDKNRYPDLAMEEAQAEIIGRVVWREGGL